MEWQTARLAEGEAWHIVCFYKKRAQVTLPGELLPLEATVLIKKIIRIYSDMKSKISGICHNELLGGVVVVLIFFLLLLNACASNEARTQAILLEHAAPARQTQADNLNSLLAQKNMQLPRPAASADYEIGPEDLLEISVFQADELKTAVRVSANGYIKMNLVGEVKTEGLSVAQLEDVIANKLRKYMKEPMVSVFVKEYRAQQISVLGSVKNPQVFYVTGQKYLIDMISMAGGLSPDAGNLCIVQTEGQQKGERMKIVIDLDRLLVDGRADLNIPVHSGDIVQIPKSGIFFVDGAVRNPGEYPIRAGTTITQAISMAKGLDYTALHSDIKIYRDTGQTAREVITTDYDDILAGKTPDVALKDKDIIIVGASGFKSFVRALTGITFYGAGFGTGIRPPAQ
jgi:polysaccharide export outer membrane protein